MFSSLPEYIQIKSHYGNQRSNRTNQPLIKHIDEGLDILWSLEAHIETCRAFALHPLLQADDTLIAYYNQGQIRTPPEVILLAMEYRNVANRFLPKHMETRELVLSPIEEVNQMLIADKIQNYRDFIKYKPECKYNMDTYFKLWLTALSTTDSWPQGSDLDYYLSD